MTGTLPQVDTLAAAVLDGGEAGTKARAYLLELYRHTDALRVEQQRQPDRFDFYQQAIDRLAEQFSGAVRMAGQILGQDAHVLREFTVQAYRATATTGPEDV